MYVMLQRLCACGFAHIHIWSNRSTQEFDNRCFGHATGDGRSFASSCAPGMSHADVIDVKDEAHDDSYMYMEHHMHLGLNTLRLWSSYILASYPGFPLAIALHPQTVEFLCTRLAIFPLASLSGNYAQADVTCSLTYMYMYCT